MEWGSEGHGHECGKESIHKYLAKYKGVLIAKEINGSETVYYIENAPGTYNKESDLKKVIDTILTENGK